jgi:hypothetical protein
MALGDNYIGDFRFIALLGNREPPRQQLEIEARPSVDGLTIIRTGSRGTPFRLRSQVDAASYNAAWTTFRQYLNLTNSDPVVLTQGGIVSTSEGFKVQVLDVRPVRIGPIKTSSGGLNAPSLGWVECDWDLVAVVQV